MASWNRKQNFFLVKIHGNRRGYSFLLKVLINSAGQKDNSLVIRNRDIIRKIRESEVIYRNISRLADEKIDIYRLGVVGKELIEYCEKMV